MDEIKYICVYCASNDHISKLYIDSAQELGRILAFNGYRLVYGGGNNGLMGVIANEIHQHGGYVVGVITRQFVDMGFAYDGADEMIVTDTMRQRKAIMEQRSDAFIGMPGGYGTLEELLEIITLKQLGIHDKPIVIFNVGSYFKGLISQFETCCSENFVNKQHNIIYQVSHTVEEAVKYIASY